MKEETTLNYLDKPKKIKQKTFCTAAKHQITIYDMFDISILDIKIFHDANVEAVIILIMQYAARLQGRIFFLNC